MIAWLSKSSFCKPTSFSVGVAWTHLRICWTIQGLWESLSIFYAKNFLIQFQPNIFHSPPLGGVCLKSLWGLDSWARSSKELLWLLTLVNSPLLYCSNSAREFDRWDLRCRNEKSSRLLGWGANDDCNSLAFFSADSEDFLTLGIRDLSTLLFNGVLSRLSKLTLKLCKLELASRLSSLLLLLRSWVFR